MIGGANNQSFVYHFVANLLLYRKQRGAFLIILPVPNTTASRHGFWSPKGVFRSLRVKNRILR